MYYLLLSYNYSLINFFLRKLFNHGFILQWKSLLWKLILIYIMYYLLLSYNYLFISFFLRKLFNPGLILQWKSFFLLFLLDSYYWKIYNNKEASFDKKLILFRIWILESLVLHQVNILWKWRWEERRRCPKHILSRHRSSLWKTSQGIFLIIGLFKNEVFLHLGWVRPSVWDC